MKKVFIVPGPGCQVVEEVSVVVDGASATSLQQINNIMKLTQVKNDNFIFLVNLGNTQTTQL